MESKDREKRLNNVIIFNLPESTSQLKTTRQQHDKEQILEMCTEINNHFTDTDDRGSESGGSRGVGVKIYNLGIILISMSS